MTKLEGLNKAVILLNDFMYSGVSLDVEDEIVSTLEVLDDLIYTETRNEQRKHRSK